MRHQCLLIIVDETEDVVPLCLPFLKTGGRRVGSWVIVVLIV